MNDNRYYQQLDQRTYYSAITCLLVFVVVHTFEGYYFQAIAGLLSTALITMLARRVSRTSQYDETNTLRLASWLSLLMMLCFTVWANTMGATYFIFPLMLSACIIFPKETALKLGIFAAIVTTIIAHRWLNSADMFRYCTSQILTMSVGYIYASVIERNELMLQQLANTDPLTQTLNRHELYRRLTHSLANCRRHQQPSCLIMIDIDHFKAINDTHGHLTGDSVLIEVCRVIEQRIRETDLLFRYGGEEFALLLPQENLIKTTSIAEDLRNKIAAHDFPKGIKLTISLGVAETHQDDNDQTLLNRADTALYQAKNKRNQVIALEYNANTELSPA